jgi:mono/diheme cytochrome c family protein
MTQYRTISIAIAVAILPAIAVAQAAGSGASAGVYTAAQATRGQAVYAARCAMCHGGDLGGQDVAPPLSGGTFGGNWKGQTAGALATRIRTTMPLDNPGSLGTAAAADVSAYILSKNGYPAGQSELPREPSLLEQVKID